MEMLMTDAVLPVRRSFPSAIIIQIWAGPTDRVPWPPPWRSRSWKAVTASKKSIPWS